MTSNRPKHHLAVALLLLCLRASASVTDAPAHSHGEAKPTEQPSKADTTASGPTAQPARLTLANALAERGDIAGAELAFRQVIEAPRTSAAEKQEALLGLARVFRRHSMLAKSTAVYEKLLAEFPKCPLAPDALLELGRTLRAMGAQKQAIGKFYSVLNSTLKVQSDDMSRYQLLAKTAQFEIAETYFETGNYEEAVKSFARLQLLDLAPTDRARARFMASYSLKLLGNLEAAAKSLRDFVDAWPDDENAPEARYLLALTLRQLGRNDLALAETLQLLRAVSSEATPPQRLAYWQRRTGNQLANDFFIQGDLASALAIYRSLADSSTDAQWRAPILYQIGLCYERLDAVADAAQAYESVLGALKGEVAPELVDLSRMASWRLGMLGWKGSLRDAAGGAAPAS